ncbi:MAG TPA: VCBS repeat-containing protein [Candidatus Polarisedimenticolia bacterium]|nr:VCBS repeat-containing protein [Candidatus Polarisedimenticolia bacterium]
MRYAAFCALVLTGFTFSLPATSQMTFYQPLNFAGCSSFVADFNGDSKPDLLCSDGTLNLGNGDGTFTPGPTVSGTVLAVADFNGDGKPDLLEQGTGTLLVLFGNGDGTFQAPITTASGAALSVVAAADLNGDGKADVMGVFNNSLYVFIGNGDGTLKAGVPYHIGVTLTSSPLPTIGDFNGDGKLDVVLSTSGGSVAGQEIAFLGNGDGTLQSPRLSAGIYGPQSAALGDFNGDGRPDLVLSGGLFSSLGACITCQTSILLGNGDGSFQAPVAVLNLAGLPAAADVNGDGKLDLIFSADPTVGQIYLGNGDGTFSSPNSYVVSLPFVVGTGGSGFGGIAIADFNMDGKLDVAVGNGILLGNGDSTFQGIPMGAPGTNPQAQISGKFEKNGAVDIAEVSGNQVHVLHNNGAGVLTLINTYTLPTPSKSMVAADFNGDGNLDLAVVQQDTSANWGYSVLLGNGDGSFKAPVFYPQNMPGTSNMQIFAADFNNDHKPDLVVTVVGNQSLAVLLGNGDGTFAPPAYYYDADDNGVSGPTSALIADFNSDGNLDIAVPPNYPNNNMGILFGKGDGTFQAIAFPTSLNNFRAAFTADFNNDGKADLLSAAVSGSQVALGNGDGTFTLLATRSFWVGGVADFNGDGKLDLLASVCCFGHIPTEGGVALGNGDGTFGPLINEPSTIYIGDIGDPLVDMNGDGRPDIVFPWFGVSGFVGGIGVLFNTTSDFIVSGSPTSQAVSAGQTASFTLSLAASGKFSGTVNLSCAVTPAATPGPTCSLSSSSEQISGTTAQSVTVKVGTVAASTTAMLSPVGLPPRSLPLGWTLLCTTMLVGFTWLALQNRKRTPLLVAPVLVLATLSWVACGGSGSSSSHNTQGTPAGTYTATVTATSGSLTHTTAFKVTVQ